MELDDLKLALQSLDRRMEQRHALDLAVWRERKALTARDRLRPLAIGQAIQLVAGIAIVLLAGSFWFDHRDAPALLVSGILLHAYGVMLIVCAALDLTSLRSIDYGAPVLTIQRRLAELRTRRLRQVPLHAVTGNFVWIPAVLVGFEVLFGVDVWEHAPTVVGWLVASGCVGLAATWAFARWMRSPKRARFARYMDDSNAGSSLKRAQAVVDEILRFESGRE